MRELLGHRTGWCAGGAGRPRSSGLAGLSDAQLEHSGGRKGHSHDKGAIGLKLQIV